MISRTLALAALLLLVGVSTSFTPSQASTATNLGCHTDCFLQRQACRNLCPDGSCWDQCQVEYYDCIANCDGK